MFVVLGIYNSEIDAQIVMGQLQEEGISSKLQKDDVGGMHPHLQLTQGVAVLVRESDFDKAKKIIDFDLNKASSESWTCENCGETHEGQFTSCWNCGTSKRT